MKVKFKKLVKEAVMPKKAHASDAGFDLVAVRMVFAADGTATYGTGLAVEIPEGYVGLIFQRSSVYKQDQMLTNAVGVIDSGYRGEIMFKFKPTLTYVDKPEYGMEHVGPHDYDGTDQADERTQDVTFHGRCKEYPDVRKGHLPFPFRAYKVGERIGQLIIMPYPEIEFEEADGLSPTDRGKTGFGHSGQTAL